MSALGIKAVSLSAETIREATDQKRNLFNEIRKCEWSVVMTSPERLAEMGDIFRDPKFRKNLLLLGLDEVHVMAPWGDQFRPAYHHMANVHKQLPDELPIVAVSASLTPDGDVPRIRKLLGWKPDSYYTLRLSNERPNVRTVIQELRHGLVGFAFPSVAHAVLPGEKAVIYCRSIDLSFRVAIYLWSLLEPGTYRGKRVRLFNSLTSAKHNAETMELFRDNPDTTTIVATIAFGMGVNVRNIRMIINLGLPGSVNDNVQQDGRAGRDGSEAVAVTLVERSVLASIRRMWPVERHYGYDALAIKTPVTAAKTKAPGRGKGKGKAAKAKPPTAEQAGPAVPPSTATMQEALTQLEEKFEKSFLTFLIAYVEGRCLVAQKNVLYGNDQLQGGEKAAMNCIDAERPLPCSNCQPFWSNPSPSPPPPNFVPMAEDPLLVGKVHGPRLPPALTKDMQAHAVKHLASFARARWRAIPGPERLTLPSSALWNGPTFTLLMHHFHLLRGMSSISSTLRQWKYLSQHGEDLLQLLEKLNRRYDARHIRQKLI